jgi:hypothetical protein
MNPSRSTSLCRPKPWRRVAWLAIGIIGLWLAVPSAAVASPDPGAIELDVNTLTGDVQLVGNSIDMAAYEITSGSAALDSSRWNSLSNQGLGDFLTFTSSDGDLNEGSLDINTVSFTGLQSYDIATGSAGLFRSAGSQDLVFTYVDAGNNFATGSVIYLPASIPEPLLPMLIVPALLLVRLRARCGPGGADS